MTKKGAIYEKMTRKGVFSRSKRKDPRLKDPHIPGIIFQHEPTVKKKRSAVEAWMLKYSFFV